MWNDHFRKKCTVNACPTLSQLSNTMTTDTPDPSQFTMMLDLAQEGDAAALDELMPVVYQELRRLAGQILRSERADHTLQATALVNEAYVRLVGAESVNWQNRAHFFGAAATAIRRILIDHARSRGRLKRGGARSPAPLDEALLVSPERDVRLLELNDALTRLAEASPQKARVVELRFFGGLTEDETAEVLGVSTRTVTRDWRFARAWLHSRMNEETPDGS